MTTCSPRTFGPLRDAVRGGPLAEALARGDRDAVLSGIEQELARPTTVLLVEDVHWADDATLDVLRFLARRLTDLPALLMLTYRDDELGRNHPLHRVLGALGGERVHRLRLQPLSRAAVARLAGGTTATSARLYALTGGNPFFVTERSPRVPTDRRAVRGGHRADPARRHPRRRQRRRHRRGVPARVRRRPASMRHQRPPLLPPAGARPGAR